MISLYACTFITGEIRVNATEYSRIKLARNVICEHGTGTSRTLAYALIDAYVPDLIDDSEICNGLIKRLRVDW